jgi:hypothetical protein
LANYAANPSASTRAHCNRVPAPAYVWDDNAQFSYNAKFDDNDLLAVVPSGVMAGHKEEESLDSLGRSK